MIASLKSKSQVTIPACVLKEAGLKVGDSFDVTYKDGNIVLTPMVFVSRKEAEVLSFANKMDETYERMLDGDYVSHDLVEQ